MTVYGGYWVNVKILEFLHLQSWPAMSMISVEKISHNSDAVVRQFYINEVHRSEQKYQVIDELIIVLAYLVMVSW